MPALVAAAVAVFVGTDLDDLVVLTALLGSRKVGRRQVVAGQYLGIAVLVAISVVASIGLVVVPDRWVGLFGVVPVGLGIRGLLRGEDGGAVVATTTMGVAGITIVNGADNVSVYTPIFREAGWGTSVYVAAFAVLVAVWLAAATFLATRKPIVTLLDRWGHRIVPVVFIVIGALLVSRVIRN